MPKTRSCTQRVQHSIGTATTATDLEDNYVQHWTKANIVMQRQGFEMESSWTEWVEVDKALKEAQELRQNIAPRCKEF